MKEDTVKAEKSIDLFLNTHVYGVEMAEGGKNIRSVVGLDVKSGKETRFVGKFFVDCTGHGSVGALAGAEFMMEEKGRMGMSNMWVLKKEANPVTWPATPWALPLAMGDFPEPKAMEPAGVKNQGNLTGYDLGYTPVKNAKDFLHGEWFWESGFDKHPINDLELIRDHNFRAVYGAVSALKTKGGDKYANYDMQWLAYIGGPRESRRIVGDMILNGEDMVKTCHSSRRLRAHHLGPGPALSEGAVCHEVSGQSLHHPRRVRQAHRSQERLSGALPLLLLQGHRQPLHGRTHDLRGAPCAGHHARDAHLRHDG
ncbi:MAG: FAD-dependent oxidoreductase [Chryseolinea sp.]